MRDSAYAFAILLWGCFSAGACSSVAIGQSGQGGVDSNGGLSGAGNHTEGGGGAIAPLCDGAEKLKFRAFLAPQPDREVRGASVAVENGFPSLGVDGKCNAYVGGGWTTATSGPRAQDLEWRTAQLSEKTQEYLNDLQGEGLLAVADCAPRSPGVFDAPPRVMVNDHVRVVCYTSGVMFDGAWARMEAEAAALWSVGVRVEQGIRVVAVESNAVGAKVYDWPQSLDLAGFAIDPTDEGSVGVSQLVTVAPDVAVLRALRDEYLNDEERSPSINSDGQVVSDQAIAEQYLYTRDALPYEDSRGLWPFWETEHAQ